MKLHANAALSLNKRRVLVERVVDEQWTLTTAAEAAEVSVRCARKWVGRYRAEGELGRIARPGHRMTGTRATKGYHRQQFGQGWEFVHIAIDDCTRLAYAEVLPDEKATTAIGFLRRAVAFYGRHGITVERLITDNGSAYRSTVHAIACRTLGIRHLRTRPYRPQTNGKAERFIRTLLGGWAYGALYRNSTERTAALDGWIDYYNHRRKHAALGHKPPIARLNERTNLLGTYN